MSAEKSASEFVDSATSDIANAINHQDWVQAEILIERLRVAGINFTQSQDQKIDEFHGIIYHRTARLEEAANRFKRIIVEVACPYALFNAALFWSDYGDHAKARELLFNALGKKDKWGVAEKMLGQTYQREGRHSEAIYFFRRALEREPCNDSWRETYALSLLSNKNFSDGWNQFEHRKKSWNLDWLRDDWKVGETIEGTRVAVIVDEGVGDAIMFSPLLERLVQESDEHVVYCDRRLITLMQRSFKSINFESRVLGERHKEYDKRIRLASLGALYWTDYNQIKPRSKYLVCDEVAVSRCKEELRRLSGQIAIGYAWGANNEDKTERDRKRINHKDVKNVLATEGVKWICLQHKASEKEIEEISLETGTHVHWIPGLTDNIDSLASMIQALDLVICSEQTVAHIAGALGIPCIVIGGKVLGWRYNCGSIKSGELSQCLWYESVRIIKSDDSALEELCNAEIKAAFSNSRQENENLLG